MFQVFQGLPKGLISVLPISECWWDPAYSGCLIATENKSVLRGLLLHQRAQYSRQRPIQFSSLSLKEQRKEWSMYPTFRLLRVLPLGLISVSSYLEHWWDTAYSTNLGVAKNKRDLGCLEQLQRTRRQTPEGVRNYELMTKETTKFL